MTEPTTLLGARALVRLSLGDAGENVAGFLQGLVTQDVIVGPLPAYAGLLSPQGKVLFAMIVWRDGDDLLLDCEAEAAGALAAHVARYRLRRRIVIAEDTTLGVHWSPTPPDPMLHAAPDPRLAALGWRWLAPRAADPADRAATADAAWRATRLTQGVAEGRAELGFGEILWLETNAAELHGVSFTKGCYVGQENTARMNWRQKVGRRLLVVPLARSDPARQRMAWPELDLALDHLRVEAIPLDCVPAWLRPGLLVDADPTKVP